MKHHRGQQEAYAFSATVYGTGEASRLSREMEIKIQSQEMFKDVASHATNGLLCHAREYSISKLLKQSCPYAGCAVYRKVSFCKRVDCAFRTCHYHRTTHSPSCAANCCEVNVHRIHNALKVEWNLHVQDLPRH